MVRTAGSKVAAIHRRILNIKDRATHSAPAYRMAALPLITERIARLGCAANGSTKPR